MTACTVPSLWLEVVLVNTVKVKLHSKQVHLNVEDWIAASVAYLFEHCVRSAEAEDRWRGCFYFLFPNQLYS